MTNVLTFCQDFSVWITHDGPKEEKNSVCWDFITELELILCSGIASGYRVAAHIKMNKYWLPTFVRGTGATQSMIMCSKGSLTSEIGLSGACG